MSQVAIGIAVTVVAFIFLLVAIAASRKPPHLEELEAKPTSPPDKWLITAYNAATSLYIEVDREIWQISTIFLSASLIIMGWVVTNLDKLDTSMVVVAGCASITLVGVSILFKHRLRIFNLLHIFYLQRIEEAFMETPELADYWGLHHVRRRLKAGKNLLRWLTSIHGVMDLYFVLLTVIWVALWLITFNRPPILPSC